MQNLNLYPNHPPSHSHEGDLGPVSRMGTTIPPESLHTPAEGEVTHTRGPGGLTPTTWVSPVLTEHPAPGFSPSPCQTPGMGDSRHVQEATNLGGSTANVSLLSKENQ